MSLNVMTPDNDGNSIPSVSMLEAGLRDRIRKRAVGLNPNSLCRSWRRYTLCYGASISNFRYGLRTKERELIQS